MIIINDRFAMNDDEWAVIVDGLKSLKLDIVAGKEYPAWHSQLLDGLLEWVEEVPELGHWTPPSDPANHTVRKPRRIVEQKLQTCIYNYVPHLCNGHK
jgi:hypothetical protein